jgi:hypothetical protein
MAYTRQEFALELKEKIQKKESIKSISQWAVFICKRYENEIDFDFKRFLSELEVLGMDKKYEFTYEQLDGFADRLLAGELEIDPYNRRISVITREEVGLQLKEKIQKKENIYWIGQWAWFLYSDYIGYLDDDFSEFLSDLSLMQTPGYELSYERLDHLADKLLAGQQVIKIYGIVENPTYENR